MASERFPDIEAWLEARATSKQFVDGQLVFSHRDDSTSILVPRHGIAPDDQELARSLPWFYDEYLGGSIGSGHIIFASSQKKTVRVSHEFKLPRRSRMTRTLAQLGVHAGPGEAFFAVAAAWMFAYTHRAQGGVSTITRYDRDFHEKEIIDGFGSALEDWWRLVCEDE